MSRVVIALLLAWAVAFAASLLARVLVVPTGDGFTRGMNRLVIMVGFQALALVLATAALVASRRLAPGDRLRRLVWGPVTLAGLFVLAIVAPFVLGG